MTLGKNTIISTRDYAREWMWKEDQLISYRMGWLLTSQAIFFGGYGLLVSRPGPVKPSPMFDLFVGKLFPIVALSSAISIYIAIIAAVLSMRQVIRNYPGDKRDLSGAWVTHVLGLQSYILLPALFIGGWLFVVTQKFCLVLAIMLSWLLIFCLMYFLIKLPFPLLPVSRDKDNIETPP